MNTPDVMIYTDGSARPNPGPAGWAAVLVDESGLIAEVCGGEPHATSNRMEVRAAIEGLRALEGDGVRVAVLSDSSYLVGTMTQGWKRRKNAGLWPALDALCARHDVRWYLVRGHAGERHNERAHTLAGRQADVHKDGAA